MAIHLVRLLNLETVEKSHVDKVQFSVGKERARAHAITDSVCEERSIGLFEPSLRTEDLGIRPDLIIYQLSVYLSRRRDRK